MSSAPKKNRRASYLGVPQFRLLEDWAVNVYEMFGHNCPYLVGSATERSDWRDVDLRLIIDDDEYARWDAQMSISRLNVVISLWGQQATGLPIDFQVQSQTEANQYSGEYRNPMGIRNALTPTEASDE